MGENFGDFDDTKISRTVSSKSDEEVLLDLLTAFGIDLE